MATDHINIGNNGVYVFRQVSGCIEVGKIEGEEQDIVHICEIDDVTILIDALVRMRGIVNGD